MKIIPPPAAEGMRIIKGIALVSGFLPNDKKKTIKKHNLSSHKHSSDKYVLVKDVNFMKI